MSETTGIIESDAPVDNTAYGRENGTWAPTFAAEEMNLFVQQVNSNAQQARSAELAAKDSAASATQTLTLVQQEGQSVQIARNAAELAAQNAAVSQGQANENALASQQALLASQQIKSDTQTLRDSTQVAANAASSSAVEAKHWADEAKRIADGIVPGTGGEGVSYVADTLVSDQSLTDIAACLNFTRYRFMYDPAYTGDATQYLKQVRLPSGDDGWVEIDVDLDFISTEEGYLNEWLVLLPPEGEQLLCPDNDGVPGDFEAAFLPVLGSYRAVRVKGKWRVNDVIGCALADLPKGGVTPPVDPPVEVILWSKMGEYPGDFGKKITNIWPGDDVGYLGTGGNFHEEPLWPYNTTAMWVDDTDTTSVKVKLFNRNTGGWLDHSVVTFEGMQSEFTVGCLITPQAVPKDRHVANNPYMDYTHGTEHYVYMTIQSSSVGTWSWGILRGHVIGYRSTEYVNDGNGNYNPLTGTKITWELVCSGGRNEVDDWPSNRRGIGAIAAQPLAAGATKGVVVAVGGWGLVCYSDDFGATWVKGTVDKTCTIKSIVGEAETAFPEDYEPYYSAVDVDCNGFWVAADGQLANWAMGDGVTGKPDGVRHRAVQVRYPYVDLDTGVISQPDNGPTLSNPGKKLGIGYWRDVVISTVGLDTRVYMAPNGGDLLMGFNPNSMEKRDILFPSSMGNVNRFKALHNYDAAGVAKPLAVLAVADKGVARLVLNTTVNSFGVDIEEIPGYPGTPTNFVTCYGAWGDWHDKYLCIYNAGSYKGAYQIPMVDVIPKHTPTGENWTTVWGVREAESSETAPGSGVWVQTEWYSNTSRLTGYDSQSYTSWV